MIMSQDPLTLYKLIILYMLSKAELPLTIAQISDFVLEKEYTNFLTLQQAVSELAEADLITTRSTSNRTQLLLTQEGRDALTFFENRISDAIKEEVSIFLRENEMALIEELSILADYYKSTDGVYHAHLTAIEQNTHLIDITLSVPTKETACAICDNWQKKNQMIYQYLIDQLF